MAFPGVEAAMTVVEKIELSNETQTANEIEADRKREKIFNKSKRILCFAAFLATLGFFTTIINTIVSFLNDILDNERIMTSLHNIMKENKRNRE